MTASFRSAFLYTLHFLCFHFINFRPNWKWHFDMFSEPGGLGGLLQCVWLFPGVTWPVVLSEAEEAPLFTFSPQAVWTAVWVNSQPFLCWTLSRHLCYKNSQTKGSGRLRERTSCMCCLWLRVSSSCSFGPRQGLLWKVLNKESIPFPCKDDFSSKFNVCTAAKMLQDL